MFLTHYLSYYRQACSLACLAQQFQTIGTHSLEIIRRCPGLECTAAQQCCARCLNGLGNLCYLLLRFNRTRAGYHCKVAATYLDLVLTLTNLNYCIGGVKTAVGAFERFADAGNALDDVKTAQQVRVNAAGIANQTYYRLELTFRYVNIYSLAFDPVYKVFLLSL